MHEFWKQLTWKQFGAAIDTLKNAIIACPEDLWRDQSNYHQFWHMAFHTLFFLDFYLEADEKNFLPPEPFTLSELAPEGGLPDRIYSQTELLTYLEFCRDKCKRIISELTEKRASERFRYGRVDLTIAELLFYNLRHVQHHSAQLNLLLRLQTNSSPSWVFSAPD